MVPNVTQAAIGDTLEFRFHPLNHSVVRAEYLMPCIPYEMSGPGKTGFFSGFKPVSAVIDDPPSHSVRVNDTNPIWFYCSAPGSCLNYGMVGVVNPAADQSIQAQHEKAEESTFMLNPGEPFPAEGTVPTVPGGNGGYGGINGTGAGDGGGTVSDSQPQKSGLSSGAIAGIVIGSVALLVLAALLFFFWGRTKSLEDEVDRKAGTVRRVGSKHENQPQDMATTAGMATLGYQHYQRNPLPATPPQPEMLHHQQMQQVQRQQQGLYNTPAPAYYTPPTHHKLDINSPTGHPAYPPPFNSPPQQHSYIDPRTPSPGTFELGHSQPTYNPNNPNPIYRAVSPPTAQPPDEAKYLYTGNRQASPRPHRVTSRLCIARGHCI